MMPDTLLPTAEAMQGMAALLADWVAFGIGLSLCMWMLGYGIAFVYDFVRGGYV